MLIIARKQAFNASSYAAFRPTYTDFYYDSLLKYHKGCRGLLIDLGTGHGNVARRLAPKFNVSVQCSNGYLTA